MTEVGFEDWLKTQPVDDKIVYLRFKYDHEETWTYSKEILEVDMYADDFYVWENDWYEGQQKVEILGCISIDDVDVPLFTPADTPQTDCNHKCDECWHMYTCKQSTQTDCETCNHYGVVSVSCDRCDKSTHDRYEPQTDCGWGKPDE